MNNKNEIFMMIHLNNDTVVDHFNMTQRKYSSIVLIAGEIKSLAGIKSSSF